MSDGVILDSGDRTCFDSGAVRDIQVGKGRCDLLPLDVVVELLKENNGMYDEISYISSFMKTCNPDYLLKAISSFAKHYDNSIILLFLDVSKHFEQGATKYGERNWEKGIPIFRFVDSSLRHLFKYLDGQKDEPHDRAFVWNLMCAHWTCVNHLYLFEEFKKSVAVLGGENNEN